MIRLADPSAKWLRLPLALNAAATVMAIGLCGIYVRSGDWDAAAVCVVLVAALLQAMTMQKGSR